MTKTAIGHAILCGFVAGAVSVSSIAKDSGLLQVDVPFEPTAFTSPNRSYSTYTLAPPKVDELLKLQRIGTGKPGPGGIHLAYELVLTNSGSAAPKLERIEISDGSRRNAKPIVAYQGPELEALLAFPDRQQPERVVVNLFLTLPGRKFVPTTLRHRVYTTDTVVETAPVGTRHSQMRVLGPPLRGGNWLVMGGPGATGTTTYHRQNTYILNGSLEAARRYSIDWVKVENGEMQNGRLAENSSYYGYGQEILAVADGVIAIAADGMPENVPGRVPPTQPFSRDCIDCGNHVVLELGPGQFATYMHLQPGSLRVAKGDRVRRGQVLGRVGNTGNSFLPHLHFHIATEPAMTGQGLPYLIERFSIVGPVGAPHPRTRELPLDGMVIDFGS